MLKIGQRWLRYPGQRDSILLEITEVFLSGTTSCKVVQVFGNGVGGYKIGDIDTWMSISSDGPNANNWRYLPGQDNIKEI